ncbi:MAG: SRPBCC domain-containing protein [Mycobacteriales bacterium]
MTGIGPGGPLRIERTFTAPAAAVFDAWTSVEVLRRWWPAGPGWDTPLAEVDVRVGGRLRLVMRDPDGAEFAGEGRYVEIDRPRRLVFSWQWDGPELPTGAQLVEVTFTENEDASTTVLLLNRGLSEAERESHREGWQASFDNLDAVLSEATGEPGVPAVRR